MGRHNSNVNRSHLPSNRSILPELGAKHPLVQTDDLAFFFADLGDNIFSKITIDESKPSEKAKKRHGKPFTIYDDPDRMGVTILERRLPRRYGQTHRIKWTRQDVGRIRGEIQNEIGRMGLADQPLSVSFNNVVRLSDIDSDDNPSPQNGRKLALVADQVTEESEFLVREHEAAINGISNSLKRFKYPYSSFVPHFTFARIDKRVPSEQMSKVIEDIGHILPLEAELLPIQFISEQEI